MSSVLSILYPHFLHINQHCDICQTQIIHNVYVMYIVSCLYGCTQIAYQAPAMSAPKRTKEQTHRFTSRSSSGVEICSSATKTVRRLSKRQCLMAKAMAIALARFLRPVELYQFVQGLQHPRTELFHEELCKCLPRRPVFCLPPMSTTNCDLYGIPAKVANVYGQHPTQEIESLIDTLIVSGRTRPILKSSEGGHWTIQLEFPFLSFLRHSRRDLPTWCVVPFTFPPTLRLLTFRRTNDLYFAENSLPSCLKSLVTEDVSKVTFAKNSLRGGESLEITDGDVYFEASASSGVIDDISCGGTFYVAPDANLRVKELYVYGCSHDWLDNMPSYVETLVVSLGVQDYYGVTELYAGCFPSTVTYLELDIAVSWPDAGFRNIFHQGLEGLTLSVKFLTAPLPVGVFPSTLQYLHLSGPLQHPVHLDVIPLSVKTLMFTALDFSMLVVPAHGRVREFRVDSSPDFHNRTFYRVTFFGVD